MQLRRKVLLDGSPALQKERYTPAQTVRCRKCHKMISVAEVDEKEYKEIKEKITELEIKLYAVRKAVME